MHRSAQVGLGLPKVDADLRDLSLNLRIGLARRDGIDGFPHGLRIWQPRERPA